MNGSRISQCPHTRVESAPSIMSMPNSFKTLRPDEEVRAVCKNNNMLFEGLHNLITDCLLETKDGKLRSGTGSFVNMLPEIVEAMNLDIQDVAMVPVSNVLVFSALVALCIMSYFCYVKFMRKPPAPINNVVRISARGVVKKNPDGLAQEMSLNINNIQKNSMPSTTFRGPDDN